MEEIGDMRRVIVSSFGHIIHWLNILADLEIGEVLTYKAVLNHKRTVHENWNYVITYFAQTSPPV